MPRKINHRETVEGFEVISSQFGVTQQAAILAKLQKRFGSRDVDTSNPDAVESFGTAAMTLAVDERDRNELLALTSVVVGEKAISVASSAGIDDALEDVGALYALIGWVIQFNFGGFFKRSAKGAARAGDPGAPDPSTP